MEQHKFEHCPKNCDRIVYLLLIVLITEMYGNYGETFSSTEIRNLKRCWRFYSFALREVFAIDELALTFRACLLIVIPANVMPDDHASVCDNLDSIGSN